MHYAMDSKWSGTSHTEHERGLFALWNCRNHRITQYTRRKAAAKRVISLWWRKVGWINKINLTLNSAAKVVSNERHALAECVEFQSWQIAWGCRWRNKRFLSVFYPCLLVLSPTTVDTGIVLKQVYFFLLSLTVLSQTDIYFYFGTQRLWALHHGQRSIVSTRKKTRFWRWFHTTRWQGKVSVV